MDNKVEFVLVCGTGRCGTNIVKEVFSVHSSIITLPFEQRFINDPDGIIDFYNSFSASWSPYIADRKIKRLESLLRRMSYQRPFESVAGSIVGRLDGQGKYLSPPKYHRWNLDDWFPNFSKYVGWLLSELVEFTYSGSWVGTESYQFKPKIVFSGHRRKEDLARIFRDFIRKCFGDLLANNDSEVFMDDSTWSIIHAKDILSILPTTKFIHIVRDPRDVISSFLCQRWCPSDLSDAASFYESLISRSLETQEQLSPDNFLMIRFEDFIYNRNQTLEKICDFIGVVLEEKMLEVDCSAHHIGRWKEDFGSEEVILLNKRLSNFINKLGYS